MPILILTLSFLSVALIIALLILTVRCARLQREINRHQIVINALNHSRISRLEVATFDIQAGSGSQAEVVH